MRGAGYASPSAKGGFTLIEVLMAAFVLALGVLGLSAMFAGAARQQQLASQQTRSVSVTQSADAMISGKVGKLGTLDPSVKPDQITIYGSTKPYPGQWFVIPIKFEGQVTNGLSYMSINPNENWSDPNLALFFRAKPNQQLPRLIYRAAPDASGRVLVGMSGTDPVSGSDQLSAAPFSQGAPSFDGSFGVPRVLSDSVQIRAVTLGYPCFGKSTTRRISDGVPETITFSLDPSDVGNPNNQHLLVGSDGVSHMLIDQQIDVTDSDFASNPRAAPTGTAAALLLIDVRDVYGGESDVNCDGYTDYIEVTTGGLNVWRTEANPTGNGPLRFNEAPSGQSLYQLTGATAELKQPYDIDYDVKPNGKVLESGSGQLLVGNSDGQPTTTLEPYKVKPINANWRFVSEIWIDSFEYRGHRVVGADDRVWYTKDPSRPNGRRADVAYSILYRDMGTGAGAQYIVFTYALRPSSAGSDHIPPERTADIAGGDSPVTLVENVTLGYDSTLAKYYVEVDEDDATKWLTEPGQVLVFAGDPDPAPKFYGADSPVSVQFKREQADGSVRGYLASAPRVGNQSLFEAAPAGTKFNIWAVQPRVKSLDASGAEWGLRPIEARVFQAYEN